PSDRPRGASPQRRGEVLPLAPWIGGADVAQAVPALARRLGATAFQIWFAAFAALLGRLTGRASLTIGVPVAGRGAASQELVGLFADTLVVPANLGGDPSGEELIAQVRARRLTAETQAEVPFEKLVEAIAPVRDRAVAPLFQVALTARPGGARGLDLAGVELTPLAVRTGTAKFDLTLSIDPQPAAGVQGAIELDADLFDLTTVERWIGYLGRLLAGMAQDPGRALSALPLLSEAERFQLLTEWNATATPFPRRSIPEVFAEQVRRTPDAIAVLGDTPITYAELDRRASQLAGHLGGLGVGLESRVGLCVERKPELIVAILGVLKAGAAYVPLDPELPQERLAWMIEDADVRAIVASDRLWPALAAVAGDGERPLVLLERDAERIAAQPVDPPEVAIPPQALAYVLFTSGSTGRPKGVAVAHQSVIRLVRGSDYASLGPEEVFLQFVPVSFDVSTLEIWGPLLNGGKLAVFPTTRATVEELGDAIDRHGVTTLWLTAGLFNLLVDEGVERLAGLRQLLAGGDALSVPRVRRALAELPGVRLVNGYGPTENTTFTTCHTITESDFEVAASVPVGRPVANTRVLLLDRDFEPVGIGVPGELLTGGEGLARGYHNRPALTAERFVPDPWSGEAGARLYRTGDLARYLADGRIEFLGRLDQQVKVRGFRIELGEIEAALLAEPGIASAAVTAWPDAQGDRRLVAYVVTEDGATDEAALATGLRRRLPEYMIPSRFVTLEGLPLDANGKVRRRELPKPEDFDAPAAGLAPSAPPATAVECELAAIWAELLGHEAVGRGDNFFDLGGHSLLAARAVERIRRAFGVELPLTTLFDEPTLAGLAGRIEAERGGPATAGTTRAIPRADRGRPLPLSFAQERLWFLEQLEGPSPVYHIAVVVEGTGRLDVGALRSALSAVWSRHEALRARFTAEDGQPFQTFAEPGPLPLAVVDLSGTAAPAVDDATADAVRRPFDLERGPLLRAVLLRLGPERFRLALVGHHLVGDGVSLAILERELGVFYRAALGFPVEVPAPPVLQHADFALWQRRRLRADGDLAEKIAAAKAELAGAAEPLGLPSDRPRGASPRRRGE
ncbi:MAG TPA: amino acid adenylation domain-containing protein, partial [Thermoanaerobaculia bacterium]|nr:amino acid adenylation domain-containing protein [Thermoanaerobaculia bacterium]